MGARHGQDHDRRGQEDLPADTEYEHFRLGVILRSRVDHEEEEVQGVTKRLVAKRNTCFSSAQSVNEPD